MLEIWCFQWNYIYGIIENIAEAFWGVYSIENASIWVVHVLGMKRVADRLVPKDLNLLQKERRVEVAKETLANVADDPTFIKRIITGDETWVYEYDVETT